MSRISRIFMPQWHKALIAYITVGYPSIEATLDTAVLLAQSGCDMIELGIPFSDPIADGVTITRASHEALCRGVTPEICLEVASKLSSKLSIPLMFMTYFNPVFHYGVQKFCGMCASCGIDGLIIPDLPPEDGEPVDKACREDGLDMVYLLAPNCSAERIRLVSQRSRGFIYLVSVTGVTGVRQELPPDLGRFISGVRAVAGDKPLCVGFGISTAKQAGQIAGQADGVIIGSRIIQLMEQGVAAKVQLQSFIAEIRQSLNESQNAS